jgi:ketosteroid isomerase-like protein
MASMTNREIIDELYRSFRQRDDAAFRAICTGDLEWIQNEGFPGGATRRGAEAVIQGVFRSFSNEWEEWTFSIDEIHDAGDTVIVLGRYMAKHRETRKRMAAPAAHIYDLRDGKVWRFRQFTDTKVIQDAMT